MISGTFAAAGPSAGDFAQARSCGGRKVCSFSLVQASAGMLIQLQRHEPAPNACYRILWLKLY
jgi:hypothetical protein